MKKLIKKPGRVGLFLVVNVVILFFLMVGFGREYVSNMQIEREIMQLEAERERLETEKLETLGLIEELSSEYYLERQARTKHGLGEPGETLVVIQDEAEDEAAIAAAAAADEALAQTSNPQRWYYYFFDKEMFAKLKSL